MTATTSTSSVHGQVGFANSRAFAFQFVAYMIALLPVTVDAISVNYSFLVVVLVQVSMARSLVRPDPWLLYSMFLYFCIFALATITQYEFHPEGPRRLISFVLFMSMFAFAFVRVDDTSIRAFKAAVVAMSICLCLLSMFKFIAMGVVIAGEDEKNAIGSQRIGFLYLIAFWLIYASRAGRALSLPSFWRAAALGILLVGLLLTFSRSSLVALAVSVLAFYFAEVMRFLVKPTPEKCWQIGERLIFLTVLSFLVYQAFPGIFDFFYERLIEWIIDPEVRDADLDDPEASGGTRAVIARAVLDFVSQHPLTGSGFLGIWIATKDFVGSAHNQYLDVLFRTGFLGFALYVWIILSVAWMLFKRDQALFWGFLGCLFYGVFHETFKESHGAFLLAFFVGLQSSKAWGAATVRK